MMHPWINSLMGLVLTFKNSGMSRTGLCILWRILLCLSVDFRGVIDLLPLSRLTQDQLVRLQSHIDTAHARGLKTRYWGTLSWPVGWRNHVWQALVRKDVDALSVLLVSIVCMRLRRKIGTLEVGGTQLHKFISIFPCLILPKSRPICS